jgi:hypothetical protein
MHDYEIDKDVFLNSLNPAEHLALNEYMSQSTLRGLKYLIDLIEDKYKIGEIMNG